MYDSSIYIVVDYRGGMTSRSTSQIDIFANQYVQDYLNRSPEAVTKLGRPGADERGFSDYSPDGLAKEADISRTSAQRLRSLEPVDDVDRVTKDAMLTSLDYDVEMYDAGEFGELNNISTPLQGIQEIFDLMGQETREDWALIAQRLANVPGALAGWQESLAVRAASGPPTATRQVELAIEQATKNASAGSPFDTLVQTGSAVIPELADELAAGATAAKGAYADLAAFLGREIAPHTQPGDASGRERYERAIRGFTGASLDLDETYEWGVSELDRIVRAQQDVSRELYGEGVSIEEAISRLNNDPARQLHGTDALQAWMQETSDEAIRNLQGTHFDIPPELEKLECMIAPSGTGAIYYTGPTSDFSRAGRMWWSVPEGSDTFSVWQEKTTVYHEGVPGHHLQVGYATYLSDSLNDWRREMCWYSGSGEGWALYAEGLMAELGYQDDPGNYMGVLDSERLRAARVVLDIGVHLEKPSPKKYADISPVWNRDVAWQFLQDNVAMDRNFLLFELNRYLGWAGQAPSYSVGQRYWKDMRASAEKAGGADFSLKDWHMSALALGSIGLDQLRTELA